MSYIDVDKKEIHYCDSMGGTGKRILEELVGYLREEMKDKKGEVLSEETWSMIDSGRSVPQQENFTDCGVFTCLNCLFCCLRRVVFVMLFLNIALELLSENDSYVSEVHCVLYSTRQDKVKRFSKFFVKFLLLFVK